MTTSIVTTAGVAILLLYTLSQLLSFYGFSLRDYSIYFMFYLFLLVALYLVPKKFS
jgi:hypothetical protein